ncbi:MAG: DUF3617 domain-containing protein [Rubrivivax sp.]|nr:MAG: DUF3617 domain-containing protein [Rubrivivax sp.]
MKFAPLLLAAAAGLCHAQTMKPGLWEFKQTPQLAPAHKAQMDQAQKALASMPPDQRKMMEQMLAQRGVNVSVAGGVISVKTCITKEQAERNIAPISQEGRCTQQFQRNGNVIQTHFVCTDPASEGDATVTLRGNEGFTNDVTVRTQRQGRTETTKVTGEGRWLGADCGSVKPLQLPAK